MRKTTKKTAGRLTLNHGAAATAPTVNKGTFQSFTFNAKTKLVRNDKMEGKTWKVVPMVMIVEGVLNGSLGALYYPATELSKTPECWNTKPIVAPCHPVKNGKGVSACSPDILDKYKVGVIMNTKFDKLGRLTAEAWIDEDAANRVEPRIMEAITNGDTLELSTGLFTDNEETEGEFEGEPYEAIARNYRPDHLAILPDAVGACSVADGAGFVRNQAGNKLKLTSDQQDILGSAVLATLRTMGIKDVTSNEMSMRSVETQLYGLIRAKLVPAKTTDYVDLWVCDTYQTYCVYQFKGKLFKQSFTTTGDTKVELEGDPSEVVRVTEYRTPDGSFVGNRQPDQTTMNKKEIVDGLIANTASGYTEKERELLMGLPEAQLQQIAANTKVKAPEKAPEPAANKAVETPKASTPKVEEVLSANQLAALNYGEQMLAQKKAALVKTITGNAKNTFPAAVLNSMTIDQLEPIAALCATNETQEPDAPAPWFGGQAPVSGEPAANNKDDDGPLGLPVMNFESGK